jgi:hypothetical protein
LAFAFAADGPDGFCPFEGGVLELSGVFGGSPSVASSSAIRAVSCAFYSTNASIRAINAEIKASLSGESDESVTHRLTHILTRRATQKSTRARARHRRLATT